MNFPSSLSKLTLPVVLGASSINATAPAPDPSPTMLSTASVSYESASQTMLLVSLDDGTVIKQMISVDADVCFKQNSSTSTTCLTQGAAVIDADTNAILGFEMIETHIDLIAKTD